MNSPKVLSNVGPTLKVALLLPIFTFFLSIIFLCVIIPFYAYRSVISVLAKFMDSGITRVISGLSATLVRDHDFLDSKPLSTIVVHIKVNGPLTICELRNLFKERVISKRSADNAFQFAELQQFYQTFMGYVFLKWDRNFDLSNHVKSYQSSSRQQVTNRDLMTVWEDLMIRPFPVKRSPWECFLVENFHEDGDEEDGAPTRKSILFLRIHHGIADGFSVQRMMCSLDPSYVKNLQNCELVPKISFVTSLKKQLLRFYHAAFFGPADLLDRLLNYQETYHTFHAPLNKHTKEYFVVESPVILVDHVKKIKQKFGVAFTTVLVSLVCSGIKKYLTKNQRQLPALQMLGIPFATDAGQHSSKLGNNFLLTSLYLPLDQTEMHERMLSIQRQLLNLHRSSLPHILSFIIQCISCLPINLLRASTKKSLVSTIYATLPGPLKQINLRGFNVDEVNFTYGTGAGSLGLCFSSITYMGKLRITIFVDKSLVQDEREQAQEMIRCIFDEYQNLYSAFSD